MARSHIHVTKTRTIKKLSRLQRAEINRVEIKTNVQYVVSSWEVVSMDKKNAETRTKLKDISSVKEFGDLMEQTMLSEEEKKILWMHYKEKKTLQCIADEIGLSEIAVKKKHRKMLMKIGRMI